MSNLEDRLNELLDYLYEMEQKYQVLNRSFNYKYTWRQKAIQEQIETLEALRDGRGIDWDECYREDLKETNR